MYANASWLESAIADTGILTTTNMPFYESKSLWSVVSDLRQLPYLPNPKSAPDFHLIFASEIPPNIPCASPFLPSNLKCSSAIYILPSLINTCKTSHILNTNEQLLILKAIDLAWETLSLILNSYVKRDERSSSSILRKRFLSPKRGSNPQPSDDRCDALTIDLPRLRWWARGSWMLADSDIHMWMIKWHCSSSVQF